MEDKNLWITFERTGSVVDYLNYKCGYSNHEKLEVGENTVESIDYSDRDDTVSNTYR
jgi:hypothetical protein